MTITFWVKAASCAKVTETVVRFDPGGVGIAVGGGVGVGQYDGLFMLTVTDVLVPTFPAASIARTVRT